MGLLGGAGDIIGGVASGLPDVPNPLAALSGGMRGAGRPGASDDIVASDPQGSMNADATAALVAQILQRAGAPRKGEKFNPTRTQPKQAGGPAGYEDGGASIAPVGGPGTLIRVGERSAKDKKYATEEVIFAPPGTVVAPVPRGMENPSHEDAVGLIMSQLLKEKGREVAPTTSGMAVAEPGKEFGIPGAARGLVTSSASAGRSQANNMAQYRGNMRQRGSEFNRDFGLRERQYFTSRDQGNRGLDLQGRGQSLDYDLGLRGLGNQRYGMDLNHSLGRESNQIARERNSNDFSLGNRSLDLNFQKMAEEFRNWEAERALKKELGMRGLDIDKQRADQDFQLGSAQQAFQQIMAGITGSALPGVRAGRTPMLGLIG